MHHPTVRLREALWASVAVVGSAVVSLTAIWSATEATHRVAPPTCYGIGFGCVPDADATASLLGAFIIAPTVVAALVIVWAAWAWARRTTNRWAVPAMWAAPVVSWMFTAVVSLLAVPPVIRLMQA